MTDLPPGKWSFYLVGAWWPGPPTEPKQGVQHWSGHSAAKEHEAVELQAFTNGLTARNSGHTTEDELMRLRIGYNRLANAAEHCRSKSIASKSVADAVDELRQNLTSIVNRYDQKVDGLVAQNTPESMAEAVKEITAANAEAAEHGSDANGKIIAATQQMFKELGIEGDAQQWLQDSGAKFSPPASRLPTSEELTRKAAGTDELPFPFGTGDMNNHAGADRLPFPFGTGNTDGQSGAGKVGQPSASQPTPNGGSTFGGNSPSGPTAAQGGAAEQGGVAGAFAAPGQSGGQGGTAGPPKTSTQGSGALGVPSPSEGVSSTPGPPNTNTQGSGALGVPSPSEGVSSTPGPPNTNTQGSGALGVPSPSGIPAGPVAPPGGGLDLPAAPSAGGAGAPSAMSSAMPSLGAPGGGMPPGLTGGNPAQAFASGIPGGPPGAGGPPPPLTPGGTGSSGFGQASASPVAPSPSVTPMAGGMLGNMAHLASSSTEVAPSTPATGAAPAGAPVAPTVSSGPASVPSAPISAGPAVPSGPLPGYGADLRPASGAVPATPAAPVGPAGPPSPPPAGGPTTPTSGGATVASTGDRPVPGKPAPGIGGPSGASVAGNMAAGGTAGAGAGTAARRLAEHQDLQRKVDAVARQAPNLAWAAGLRDDETTTVLVTDLAGGWIPPTVKLPPGVALLDPAHRRRDTSAVDLLGAVIAAAAHQPNTYITEAGPNDPIPGSGERARYGQHIDELGPTLIDVTGANPRLPRIVQTVARAMARRSGVADNEIALFRQVVTETQARVLSAYPQHAPRDVADWMLLAAIDALIGGSEELARYHLAWYQAVTVRHGGVTP
ncbi:DUF5631 domain-containing protein [Mycolicibacter longobardus]|nr:DUF5631 domain-containing protein [Mycolicibacter longobardus]